MDAETIFAAQVVWDFMRLEDALAPTDVILCLGTNCAFVPVRGAELWHQGLAPVMVMSGGIAHVGDLAATGWDASEARVYTDIAMAKGVAENALRLEERSTNTAENFRFSRPVIEAAIGRPLASAIVVARPHMTRRARATADIEWPDVAVSLQTETISMIDYLAREADPGKTLNQVVGDFQRIVEYPKRGFQSVQVVPDAVMTAFEVLTAKGYDRHLLRAH